MKRFQLNKATDPDAALIGENEGLRGELDRFAADVDLLQWVASGAKTTTLRPHPKPEWQEGNYIWAEGPGPVNRQLLCILEVTRILFGSVNDEILASENLPPGNLGKIILRRIFSQFMGHWVGDDEYVTLIQRPVAAREPGMTSRKCQI